MNRSNEMLTTVSITTAVWIAVTMLTSPEPDSKLVAFYQKVRPEGAGWMSLVNRAGLTRSHASGGLTAEIANWILGCLLIYSSLFAIGKIIFQEWKSALIFSAVAVITGALITRNVARIDWRSEDLEAEDVGSGTTVKAIGD